MLLHRVAQALIRSKPEGVGVANTTPYDNPAANGGRYLSAPPFNPPRTRAREIKSQALIVLLLKLG
jgi:hypothetical protein